jgi:hypothetical protein
MTTTVAANMARKRIVKDMNGNIIDWYDGALANPWVIQKRQVLQPEVIEAENEKKRQEQEGIKAMANPKVDPTAPDRTVTPNLDAQLQTMEERITKNLDAKLDKILQALK